MSKYIFAAIILITSLTFPQTATPPSSGDGSSGNPYQIANLENLYWIASNASNWNKYYIQTADIDASETSSWFSGAGWVPIGNGTTSFSGSYNGQNNSITGLYINNPSVSLQGLFGKTNGATVTNVKVTGSSVTGNTTIGILVGSSVETHIYNSHTSGSVTGSGVAGGLVGSSTSYSLIEYSSSSANVSIGGSGYRVGGLAGVNSTYSYIKNCFARGSVTGYQFVGGLVGFNGELYVVENDDSTIEDCFSTGYVTGTLYKGGLAGNNDDGCIVTTSFWDMNTAGEQYSPWGTPKSTSEMKTLSTFTNAGWDFTNIWDIDGVYNNGYPFLVYERLTLPLVTTADITDITDKSATANGTLDDLGYRNFSQHGFCWNTTGDPTTADLKTELGVAVSTGAINSAISSLSENTTYYVKAYAVNDVGTVYGNQVSFTTYAYPEVQTDSVSNITGTSALFNGTIINSGFPNVYQHGACWNTTGNPTLSDSFTDEGEASGTGPFTSLAFGLLSDTTYYIRAYAINEADTVFGDVINFTTGTFTPTAPTYGDGSENDPYLIYTIENLAWLDENPTEWNKHYAQMADIDAYLTQGWNSGQGWIPIGNLSTAFTGTYEGNGYVISNLFINRYESYQGFFGNIDNAKVTNLGLEDIDLTVKDDSGGLSGRSFASIVIGCYATGTLVSTDASSGYCGGFIGNHSGTGSTIMNCYSGVSVSGANYIGGFAYYIGASVENCYSYGNVTATVYGGGGFVASGGAAVANCFWDKEASGITTSTAGTGKTTAEMKTESTFTDAGWDFVNIWAMNGSINNGYPSFANDVITVPILSTVSAQNIFATSAEVTGNIIYAGNPAPTSHGICWNTTGSPTTSDDLTNEGAADFTGTFISSLTDINASTTYYARAYAVNDSGTSYGGIITFSTAPVDPVQPSYGDGTSGDPYQIATLANLYWISQNTSSWNKYFIQTADINAGKSNLFYNGLGWQPIGSTSVYFTGNYNGQSYTIDSLYINRTAESNTALFGYLSGATISKVRMTNARIYGKYYSASLAAQSSNSTLTECSVENAVVSGMTYVGGIIGTMTAGTISKCYSSASLTGTSTYTYVGGLVGLQQGTNPAINNSYSRGTVNGKDYVGGLVGNIATTNGSVTKTYSTAYVTATGYYKGGLIGKTSTSNITLSFWDTQASGTTSSAGGTGKTTAEMKTITTFTDAGWDFVDIWNIDGVTNNGYPFLILPEPPLSSPSNLVVSISTDPEVSWDAVSGATSYTVYYSEDPYAEFPSGWTEITGVTETNWTDTGATETKKFYIVTAVK